MTFRQFDGDRRYGATTAAYEVINYQRAGFETVGAWTPCRGRCDLGERWTQTKDFTFSSAVKPVEGSDACVQ